MSLPSFSLEEVKLHQKVQGKEKDAWIVLHDKVYDVSKFVDEVSLHSERGCECWHNILISNLKHPGGHEILGDHVGKDSTTPFNDQGHSSDARLILKQYLIGILDEVHSVSNLNSR